MSSHERETVEGFTWKRFATVNLELLVPDAWFTKEHTQVGVPVFTASREKVSHPMFVENWIDITAAGYTVGLTINVHKKASVDESKELVRGFKREAKNGPAFFTSDLKTTVEYPFIHYRREVKGRSRILSDGERIEAHTMVKDLWINEATGTNSMAWFDTPSEIWGEWKETGKKMLDSIKLDPNF